MADWKPEVLVISSPHTIMYTDYFHISPRMGASGSMASFGAPQTRLDVKYDTALRQQLVQQAETAGLRAGTLGDGVHLVRKAIWKQKQPKKYEYLFGSGDYGQMYHKSYETDSYMFNLQDVDGCIQNANTLINSSGMKEQLKLTIMQYISLMLHPGLVTPTQDEVCMQIAQAAKLNSGYISRQVGAVMSDMYGNILSIGWNDPAATQGNECISCIRRSVKKLLQEEKMAYRLYGLSDEDVQNHFRKGIQRMVNRIRDENRADSADSGGLAPEMSTDKMTDEQLLQAIDVYVTKKLRGLPLAYCFKDIYTDMIGKRNQVHTHAQHGGKAMENRDKARCSWPRQKVLCKNRQATAKRTGANTVCVRCGHILA